MQTRLFEWASEHGLTVHDLAPMLGYSERQLYRIRDGHYPVTEVFMGRVIYRLGEDARSLFFAGASELADKVSEVEYDTADAS